MLKIGYKVPTNIPLTDENGITVTLEKYIQDFLVIYFYPKDETPGCTEEACSFRDFNDEITKTGAKVIGISSDNQKSHFKFKRKHSLNFELLSDETHELQEAFGIWAEKSMFGKTFMGTLRSTFIVNSQSEIVASWADNEDSSEGKVLTETHGEDVLNKLKVLNKK